MPTRVRFTYYTGLERSHWFNPRLSGSWNGWTPEPMDIVTASDGPAFEATVDLEPGQSYQWGVFVDSAEQNNIWAIMDEAGLDTTDRHRTFFLADDGAEYHETYFFSHNRRLGAQEDIDGKARFSVWAPNARAVEVVFADASGYVFHDGRGIDPDMPPLPLRAIGDGVWESDATVPFATVEGKPYMFRVTRGNGDVRFRTDLYSRSQIGRGRIDPAQAPWDGSVETLDGTKSCSVVVDAHVVDGQPAHEFWRDEMNHERPLPPSIEDMVIYEVHVGSLGFGKDRPGSLDDAAAPELLDHLEDL